MDSTSQEKETKKKKRRKEHEDIKMDYVPSKEGRARPFVAYFPTGYDPVAAAENGIDGAGLAGVEWYQGADKMKARHTQLVASTHGQVDFVGLNYAGEAAAWQPCSYALGVYDKEKGTLKLVPLAGEKILRMEPRVRGVNYDLDASDEGEAAEETREAALLKRKMLTETFGSQKSKNRAHRLERGLVKEEALGDAEDMENLFQEAGQNESLLTNAEALQQAKLAIIRNIPPYDISANTPQGAYPLDKLIIAEEWEHLNVDELKSAAKKAKVEDALRQMKTYPNFVLSRLRRIRVEGDKEGNERRAKMLVYLRHLLAFKSAPNAVLHSGSQSDTFHDPSQELGIPSPILSSFLERFTGESVGPSDKPRGRRREKEHHELITNYALLVALAVDDYQTDPYDMAVELKMSMSQIRPYYSELGCKIDARSAAEKAALGDPQGTQGRWRVTLPVPLKFPEIRTYRGPARGR